MKPELKKSGMEPKEAQKYIIDLLKLNDTKTTRNKVTKFLLQYKPVIINTTLKLIGFKAEDVQNAADDFCNKLIDKAFSVFEKSYNTDNISIEDFRTPSYGFNRIYEKDGTPTQYTKMINYIDTNKFAEPIELIVASKENEGVVEFDKLNLEMSPDKLEAIRRYSGGILNLIRAGILRMSEGEIVEGKKYKIYKNFILEKEKELKDSGVEPKEA